MLRHFTATVLLSVSLISACATPEPEACTTEWIDWKKDRLVRQFALENRGLVSDLRKLAKDGGNINTIQAIALLSKADDFQKFFDSFQTTLIPEIQSAVKQCAVPEKFMPVFTEFLRDEGVSEEAIGWIEPVVGIVSAMQENETAVNTGE